MDKKLEEYKAKLHREIDDIKSWDHFYINVSWSIEDVENRAEALEINITTEEAVNILRELEHHHDGDSGITWSHIDNALDGLEESRKEPKDNTPSEVIQGEYVQTD